MVEIKPARLPDLPELQQVAIASYRDTFTAGNTAEDMEVFLAGTYSLAKLEQEFYEPRSWIFVAWEGNQQLGFVRLRENEEAEKELGKNTLELQRLYVLPQAQGKSVGKMLMEQALSFATENSYEWLWLGVWEKNVKAQKFYSKWGFTKFSEHTFMMGYDAQNDYLLCKNLHA